MRTCMEVRVLESEQGREEILDFYRKHDTGKYIHKEKEKSLLSVELYGVISRVFGKTTSLEHLIIIK